MASSLSPSGRNELPGRDDAVDDATVDSSLSYLASKTLVAPKGKGRTGGAAAGRATDRPATLRSSTRGTDRARAVLCPGGASAPSHETDEVKSMESSSGLYGVDRSAWGSSNFFRGGRTTVKADAEDDFDFSAMMATPAARGLEPAASAPTMSLLPLPPPLLPTSSTLTPSQSIWLSQLPSITSCRSGGRYDLVPGRSMANRLFSNRRRRRSSVSSLLASFMIREARPLLPPRVPPSSADDAAPSPTCRLYSSVVRANPRTMSSATADRLLSRATRRPSASARRNDMVGRPGSDSSGS